MRAFLLLLLVAGFGCGTMRPKDDLKSCESERLAEPRDGFTLRYQADRQLFEPLDGFMLRFQADSLESVIAAQMNTTIEEIYGDTFTEYVERSIAALRSEAEDGAELWWFDGPFYPSWEGVAAVRDCEIVETWIIMQA